MRAAAAIFAAAAVASCTLLGSREIHQCDVDSECAANATRTKCVDHLCASPGSVVPDAAPDSEIPDGGPDVKPPTLCTKNAECEDKNICVDGTCRPVLDNARCPRLANGTYANAYREDGALIVGAYVFSPLSSGNEVKAIELAAEQINQALPASQRFSVVFCEKKSKLGDGSAQASVDHLVSLKVPVIVGQFEASELASLKRRQIAVWSTLGNQPAIQQEKDAVPGAEVPYRFLLDELKSASPGYTGAYDEALDRANKVADGGTVVDLRIRSVTNGQIEAEAARDAIEAQLGLTQGSGGYERVASSGAAFEGTGTISNATNALQAAGPQIIIALGGDEIAALIAQVDGAAWSMAFARPIWIVSTRAKVNALQLEKLPFQVKQRIIGVDFAGDAAKLALFRAALTANQNIGSFDQLYDAMFAVGFAAARVDVNREGVRAPITPALFNDALDDVLQPPGAGVVTVEGAADLVDKFPAIQAGNRVSFVGTTGPWVFPVATKRGVRKMGQSYFCFKAVGDGLHYYQDAAALSNGTCARP